MTRIALFNAQHDLALAHGRINYVPTALVNRLLHDLQWLPLWYEPADCRVLAAEPPADALWRDQCGAVLGEGWQDRLVEPSRFAKELKQGELYRIEPWGWDLSVRHRLALWGLPHDAMPAEEQLACWRELAHRRITRQLLEVMDEPVGAGTAPQELTTLGEVERYVGAHGECYVKAPWSGSGSGVFQVSQDNVADMATVIAGIIRRQGSVMCERALDKVLDFAIELEIKAGKVTLTGYSVFATDAHHQFDGSLVMQHDALRAYLLEQCPRLDEVERRVMAAVGQCIAPHYEGVLGVDMMLYVDDGVRRVAPCVEVNLRHTMGMVAAALGERVLAPGRVGRFKTEYAPQGIVRKGAEAQIAAGRLEGGRLYLTPMMEGVTKFAAVLEVEETS